VDLTKNTFGCSLNAVLCIILLVGRYPVDSEWLVYILKKTTQLFTFRPTLFLFWDAKSADKLTYVVFCPYQRIEGEWNFRAVML